MNDISMLARRWLRQAELGRGIRLSAEETDLLNAIGIGELLTAEAAKTMRAQCAYSDEAGHLFRAEAGHRTDLKPAIIPG